MTQSTRRSRMGRSRLGATLAFAILLAASADRAEAQYGYGGFGGYGFGFGYNQNAYTDVNYLNSRSLNNAAAAAASKPQPLTAPKFESRDDSFYQKYDLASRVSMIDRVARDPGRELGTADASGVLPSVARPRPSPTASQPASPSLLANFFDRNRRLVWPSLAPITGDLGKKQEIADQAALGVLNDYQKKGLAPLSEVTEARKKLLEYGKPALEYVRKQTTPAMADSFHVFLLSLYSNIELTATNPKPPL